MYKLSRYQESQVKIQIFSRYCRVGGTKREEMKKWLCSGNRVLSGGLTSQKEGKDLCGKQQGCVWDFSFGTWRAVTQPSDTSARMTRGMLTSDMLSCVPQSHSEF